MESKLFYDFTGFGIFYCSVSSGKMNFPTSSSKEVACADNSWLVAEVSSADAELD